MGDSNVIPIRPPSPAGSISGAMALRLAATLIAQAAEASEAGDRERVGGCMNAAWKLVHAAGHAMGFAYEQGPAPEAA
jgi:hypothetical protein